MQQPISAEIHSLLSTESVKVACSSVLKEMAVDCDLRDLEEVLLEKNVSFICETDKLFIPNYEGPKIQLVLKINMTMKCVKFVD